MRESREHTNGQCLGFIWSWASGAAPSRLKTPKRQADSSETVVVLDLTCGASKDGLVGRTPAGIGLIKPAAADLVRGDAGQIGLDVEDWRRVEHIQTANAQ